MFVPDDARARRIKDQLTPAAWLVYESHCARRNNHRHKNERLRGLSFATKNEVAAAEGIAIKTVQNAYTELKRKQWIEELPDGSVRLLVGDFSPVDTMKAKPAAEREHGPETGTLFPDLGIQNPYLGTENPDLGKERPDLGKGAYIGSRARSLQPSPADTSTHTPAPAAGAAEREEAPAARVCVDGLTFDDYLGYAQSEPGIGNPRGWTMVHFAKRDADPFVAEWKEQHAQVLECRAPVEQQLTPYHVAAQAVASVASVPGYDVAAYIAQMQGVSEETRAKLRRTFVEQARAHAPP
jgi:hypothetical protein